MHVIFIFTILYITGVWCRCADNGIQRIKEVESTYDANDYKFVAFRMMRHSPSMPEGHTVMVPL